MTRIDKYSNKGCLLIIYCLILFQGKSQEYPGFRVSGRHLYDRCGEKVVLRGLANPNIWFEKNGNPRYEEIEKTGANVVRIVWQTNGTADELNQAITNCREKNMIPMVELHDATGDWSKLQQCINYWIRTDIVAVIRLHEEYLLINIANECGNNSVSKSSFRTGYEVAVLQMRNAGIHVPLVIDGTDWGKNIDILQSEGPYLINADPDHNLIFSVHMWWPEMYGFSESDIADEISESVGMDLPLIVGEFSQMHGECTTNTITSSNSIAYRTIIRECQKNEVGYIAWSWFGNCNDFWDMSSAGTFATLYDWGLEVAVTDTNSITNTSVRPYFMINGVCNSAGIDNTKTDHAGGIKWLKNYPNPFDDYTHIAYELGHETHVKLAVYNRLGEEIKILVDAFQRPGHYEATFFSDDTAQGLYLISLVTSEFQEFQKMICRKKHGEN